MNRADFAFHFQMITEATRDAVREAKIILRHEFDYDVVMMRRDDWQRIVSALMPDDEIERVTRIDDRHSSLSYHGPETLFENAMTAFVEGFEEVRSKIIDGFLQPPP